MKIIPFLLFYLFTAVYVVNAQTLFTYGTHTVSANEFLEAYNKNPDSTGNREEKLKEYLDLYINFKLKLQAAYDEKVNTNADLKAESDNFKSQLTDNFINKQANLSALIREAFLRSQKDILVQQVFVQFPSENDTVAAYAQISKAYNELKTGKEFREISVQYSNAQSVKDVSGDVGYITVFTLPYTIENIIYSLKPGEFSTIYKSRSGYHIFKNVSERPAVGRRKIEQLLFATPPYYTEEQVNLVKQQADSVYNVLQSGTSFTSLLSLYGHNYDNSSDNAVEIKVGDYNSDFEKQVFNLKATGDISKPFKTAYGYNLIKLIEMIPIPADENNAVFETYLETQVQNSGRLDAAKQNLIATWLGATGFKEAKYNKLDLWSYTDSALINNDKLFASYKTIKPETVLFEFTKEKITVKDWVNYLTSEDIAPIRDATGYNKQLNGYIHLSCNNYYRQHIEDFDTSASAQIKEFNEANMLFYVMDKHVWTKASSDTAGLEKYYEAHKNDYKWGQSITALVISLPEKNIADSIALKIKSNPADWRTIVAPFDDIYADSSRFDTGQLPVKQQVMFEKDFQTTTESNEEGNAYMFIHVLNCYKQPSQKSFEEAKGALINDYQQQLEKAWLSDLSKRYPVKVNNEVFKTLH